MEGLTEKQALRKHSWRTSILHGLAILFLSVAILLNVILLSIPRGMGASLRIYLVSVQSVPAVTFLVLLLLPSVRRRAGLVQFFSAIGFAIAFYAFGITTDTVISLYRG
jgi:hypothetical protein